MLLVLLAVAGCTKPPVQNQAASAPEDVRLREVEDRKDDMLRQLAVCETGGHGDSERPIYGGRGAFVGRFQFSPRTVINYVMQMDGRTLSVKEAVALAHDYQQASELAKFVLFEKDGAFNWPLCNRKLQLTQQVAEIKALAAATGGNAVVAQQGSGR